MADGRDEKGRTSTKYAAKKAATERIAAQRVAQQRADRKRNLLMAGGGVLAVVVVIGGIVFAGLHTKKGTGSSLVIPASSAVTQAITSVASSSLTGQPDLSTIATPPAVVTGAPALTSGGKPQVLYVGAEYCPYCAATRWALAVALTRFGTFSGLSTTYSSSTDTDPHTPTLSFRNAAYKSSYVDFDGKEQVDGNSQPLQNLTTAENALFQKYGNATAGATPGYPFIYFGGKWKQNGPSFDPAVLKGMTPDEVASTMSDAKSKPGAAIQASADVFTAEICDMTGGKPTNVCTATSAVTATTALASLTTSK